MDINKAKEIVSILVEGTDPITGKLLDEDNVCNKGEVVRAFYTIIETLDKKHQKNLPVNVGKPWTKDEERQLEELYNSGLSKKEISDKLGRTKGSISSRLERLSIDND